MGAELASKRAGKKTKTAMNASQLSDFAKSRDSNKKANYRETRRARALGKMQY